MLFPEGTVRCEWKGHSVIHHAKKKTQFFKVNCLITLDKITQMYIMNIRQYILQISSP